MKKRTLSLCIVLSILIQILAGISLTASATESEKCGDGLYWEYDEVTQTLTISGSGDMYDYALRDAPWYSYCDMIKHIALQEGISTIGDCAFFGCDKIETATVPNGVTKIGGSAFAGCASLVGVTLPNTVMHIGYQAFGGCTALVDFDLPDSVTRIEDFAWNQCSSLPGIRIPAAVTEIGIGAFAGCDSLDGIWVDSQNEEFASDDFGVLFIKDKTELICAPCGLVGTYYIPDTVTCIDDRAFYACRSLRGVSIPDSVSEMGNYTFAQCEELSDVTIPGSISELGGFVFAGCNSLTDIVLPEGVVAIGNNAFFSCAHLCNVTIPNSLTHIGNAAFSECSSLHSITIPESVGEIGAWAFANCNNLTHVHFLGDCPTLGESAFAAENLTVCYLENTAGWEQYHFSAEPWHPIIEQQGCETVCYSCPTCGGQYTRQEDRHQWQAQQAIAPTCTEDGSIRYTCSVCNAEKDEVQPAFGHRQGAIVAETDVYWECNCLNGAHTYLIEKDARVQAMQSCGVVLTFDDPEEYAWIYASYNGSAAVQSANQKKNATSSIMKMHLTADRPFALSFDYAVSSEAKFDTLKIELDDMVIAAELSGNPDDMHYENAQLGAGRHTLVLTYTKSISGSAGADCAYLMNLLACTHEALQEHAAIAPTCTEDGCIAYWTCEYCNRYFADADANNAIAPDAITVDAPGHDMVTIEPKEPTCTEAGCTAGACCSRCGNTVGMQEISALGHAWDNGVVTTPSTPTKEGIKTYTCIRCGANKTEVLPATGENPCDRFTDMPPEEHWSYPGIYFAVTNGLFAGTSETTCCPDAPMTRAMLVTVLWRYEEEPTGYDNLFVDVPTDRWYTNAIAWAAASGVVSGVGNDRFCPNGAVTREQIAAILFRCAKNAGCAVDARTKLSAFPDHQSVSGWAQESLQWAVAEGLVSGVKSGGQIFLRPKNSATRAQVAAILMRYIQNVL